MITDGSFATTSRPLQLFKVYRRLRVLIFAAVLCIISVACALPAGGSKEIRTSSRAHAGREFHTRHQTTIADQSRLRIDQRVFSSGFAGANVVDQTCYQCSDHARTPTNLVYNVSLTLIVHGWVSRQTADSHTGTAERQEVYQILPHAKGLRFTERIIAVGNRADRLILATYNCTFSHSKASHRITFRAVTANYSIRIVTFCFKPAKKENTARTSSHGANTVQSRRKDDGLSVDVTYTVKVNGLQIARLVRDIIEDAAVRGNAGTKKREVEKPDEGHERRSVTEYPNFKLRVGPKITSKLTDSSQALKRLQNVRKPTVA